MPAAGRALIVFLGLVAFWPAVRCDFQLDDHMTIVSNPALRNWSTSSLRLDWGGAAGGPSDSYFRPLQPFVNRIQYQLFGVNPIGYHFTNLLLHIGNALLVLELLLTLSFSAFGGWAVACLFVVHPIIVSELMMASGIPELLCLFFSLAAVLFWRRAGNRALTAGLACYALALLSKESAIGVPLYWALCTRFMPSSRNWKPVLGGILLVTLGYAGLRLHALGAQGAFPWSSSTALFMIQRFPSILMRYAGLAYFPWHLHSYRLMPTLHPLWGYAAGLSALALYWKAERPAWARWAAAWALLSLLPKLPLMVTGYYMLEHWLYPGLPALLLPVGMGLAWAWSSRSPLAQRCATGIFGALICLSIFSARYHLIVRGSDELNYRWSLQFTRSTPLQFNLGLICLRTGRPEEALHYIQPIHALYPQDPVIAKAFAAAQAAVQTRPTPQHPQTPL